MNARTLRRLAAVLAALVVVWIGLSALGRARRDTERHLAMARFDVAAADHARIVHGADTLTFARVGMRWTVNGLAADVSLVHSLVVGLADTAAQTELVSQSAATLAALGLDSLHARRITVSQGGHTVAELLTGNHGPMGGALYVRRPGENAAYSLANGLVDLVDKPLDGWRDRTIADVPPDSVTAVDVDAGRTRYALRKTDGKWRLGSAAADSAAVALLLGRFHALYADGFATPGQTDSVRRARPQRTVELLAAGDRPLLVVHVDSARSGWYALRDGDSTVYRMEDWDSRLLTPPDSALKAKPKKPLPKARGTD